MMRERARAKVNLSLAVRGKRPDGYHDLLSLVAFADFGDDLTFIPGSQRGLSITGPFAAAIDGVNLIEKATNAAEIWFGRPLPGDYKLEKHIPVAAGLGGGSSDAAAALRALAQAYKLTLPEQPGLGALVSKIGADVPVCLAQTTAWMWGIGECIQPVQAFPSIPAVLANPGIPLSTKAVFQELNAPPLETGSSDNTNLPLAFASLETALAYLTRLWNDLQEPAIRLAPVIQDVIAALAAEPGCRMARLSGSGPTCFGLFSSAQQAAKAARNLSQAHPGWWNKATFLG